MWGGGYIWVTAQDLGTCHTGDKSALKTVMSWLGGYMGLGIPCFVYEVTLWKLG